MRKQLITLALWATLANAAQAADFEFFTDASLGGYVTFDEFLGNGDDSVFAGINTIGAGTQSSASNGVYAFFEGTMSTQGLPLSGPQSQQIFGSNIWTAQNLTGEWNINPNPLFPTGLFNQPFVQTYIPDAGNFINISTLQTYTTRFLLDDTASGGTLEVHGQGRYLLAGENPSDRYSGDLLGHFNFVKDLLDVSNPGWVGIAQESQTWTVTSGPNAGVTGVTTTTFFSLDPNAIPVVEEGLIATNPSFGALDMFGNPVGWMIAGAGSVDIVTLPDEQNAALLTTGSPVILSQLTDTSMDPFNLLFDYEFLTDTGTLTVSLGGQVVGLLDAPLVPMGSLQTASLLIDDPLLLGLIGASLEFELDGITGSQLLLDNVTVQAVPIPPAFALFAPALLAVFHRRRERRT